MNATAETFAQFESLNDLKNPPANWEGAMEAVIAGAVDHDEIEPLCLLCCAIADDAVEHENSKQPDEIPSWSDWIERMLDQLEKSHIEGKELPGWCEESFQRLGKLADYWIAEQSKAATK